MLATSITRLVAFINIRILVAALSQKPTHLRDSSELERLDWPHTLELKFGIQEANQLRSHVCRSSVHLKMAVPVTVQMFWYWCSRLDH